MQTGPADNEIIKGVLGGEQALYAHLVKRYQNFVFTIVLRYTTSREDAEEIAQDVFVKAYRSLALSYFVTQYMLHDYENPALWFAFLAIGGGAGLIASYKVEKKELLDPQNQAERRAA